MTEQGFIKIHRKIQESEMYQKMNAKQRSILFDILLAVNWKPKEWDYKGEHYVLNPGQMVTSLEKLKEKCAKDVSIKNLRTCLQMMKNYGFLTNHSTKQNRTLSICNWDRYQVQTANETANEVAKTWQRSGKDLATIEERKNSKKYNNKKAEAAKPAPSRTSLIESMKPETRELWDYWQGKFSEITTALEDNRSALNKLLELEGSTAKVKRLIDLAALAWKEKYTPKEAKASSPAQLWNKRATILAWGKGRFTQEQTSNKAF